MTKRNGLLVDGVTFLVIVMSVVLWWPDPGSQPFQVHDKVITDTVTVHTEPDQEQLGQIILMVASGWTEWPKYPQCEQVAGRYKVPPCMYNLFVITHQDPFQEWINPQRHVVPVEKEL